MQDKNNYAFRIGGEEFAILLTGESNQNADEYLFSIKDQIEGLEIAHEDSQTSKYLTISIGAHIILPDSDMTQEMLYNAADKALYQAKKVRNTLAITSDIA